MWKSGYACYHSVQNLLSSSLLFKNVKNMYRTVILPVLYVCETLSLTLSDEHRLMVFENRVLRRIFGPDRAEITRVWRKLHNGELNILYSSPNVVRVIKIEKNEMGGACSTYGGEERCIQGFGGEA